MTIGSVCKSLEREFPDISISKIRYLENQRLLTPRRTAGGYRLYSPEDVGRLRTILRLQRDEFLPLRIIRQEMATGRADAEPPQSGGKARAQQRRLPPVVASTASALRTLEEMLELTGADEALVRELEEFKILPGSDDRSTQLYDENQCESVRAAAELSRYGVAARNLRVFKTSADRESALLQQILAPSLRSRNVERRQEATEALEDLAAVTTHLKHLLLVGDLRALLS
jgi:DNA-binding transcriptional MerR regulator